MRELPSGGVTFCFTDIEGSSAVNARLGDDAYRLVLDRHRDLLRVAWGDFGGVEVSTEGDGCFVAFHDAGAAVNACRAAQALIGSEPWPTRATIRVRMGVHSGVAHPTSDGDYVSIVVSQAARVAASAHGGQVVVSATTAGAVETGMLRPLGRHRLRDFADPIELFQLVPSGGVEFPPLRGARSIDVAAGVGIPSWLRVEDRWALAGRRSELIAIRQAVDDVVEGGRRGVFLGGEPGVGKTRLVVEAARHASQRGMVVLGGRCDVGMTNPFGIVTEALRQLVGAVDATVLRSNLGRWPEELARVVPELTDALPELGAPLASDLETERWRLFDAISSAMAAIAAPGGLMLVVDDAQWAPAATVAVLRHLLRAHGPERLLVLGTHRDSEQDVSAAWLDLLADLARLDHVERHTLVGLDDAEMAELVATVTGHPPPLGVLSTKLGSHERAEAHLLTAIEENASAGSSLWSATATADLAALHLLRGDRTAAAEAIEQAEAQAAAISAARITRLCDRLRDELARTSPVRDGM